MPSSASGAGIRRAIGVGIGLHFLFVLCVILHASDWLADQPAAAPLNRAMAYYDALTFSNRNFGFFAPEVNGDCTVDRITFNRAGASQRRRLGSADREMQIKHYAMIGAFLATEDSMDLFARSWALNAMNADPKIVRVDIEVRQNILPSMAEYRAGRRIEERLIYRTTFHLE